MPEELPVVLEPDIDETCYLFSLAIMRLMEEEDAVRCSSQKHSHGLNHASSTDSPIQAEDSGMPQEKTIDQ